jgi:hypothetical protein
MSATNWTGGNLASAEHLAQMLPKMYDWTPDWSTTSGANTPSYGNAVIDCRYSKSGDLVVAHFDITFGSTTNFNSGTASDNFIFSLPVAAKEVTQAVGDLIVGTSAGGARVVCRARLFDENNVELEIANNRLDSGAIANTGLVDRVSPFTFGTNSSVKGVVEYEAA